MICAPLGLDLAAVGSIMNEDMIDDRFVCMFVMEMKNEDRCFCAVVMVSETLNF